MFLELCIGDEHIFFQAFLKLSFNKREQSIDISKYQNVFIGDVKRRKNRRY
ncbi:hypothetical protein [Alkalihalobacillus sp. BA299]|uniref:hypothetical protein n=1 Tax=Alkalihalobacillus sp. BA299 TaxID=2815938 RepID=UPI001ADB55AA|nr:hypothetical protein [Alkalihalobacillus sp. BA299]